MGILSGKYRTGEVSYPRLFWPYFYMSQLDPFKETAGSKPLRRRVFSRPRELRRAKLEPLFVVLEEIAEAHGKTISQVALNWLINKDPLVVPIPGAKNARQARENAGALGWHLMEEECARINQAEIDSR